MPKKPSSDRIRTFFSTFESNRKMRENPSELVKASEQIAPTDPLGLQDSEIIENIDLPIYSEPTDYWSVRKSIVIGKPAPNEETKAVSPHYRQTPYRPDTAVDGWSTDKFTVRAVSQRGQIHRYGGEPRQDDFALDLHHSSGRLVAAIADGVSAAEQSHVGSTLAVRSTIQWLRNNLDDDMSISTIDWNTLIEHAAYTLIDQAAALFSADRTPSDTESLLATTLTGAIIEPYEDGQLIAHLFGVGDSGVWIFDQKSQTYSRAFGTSKENEGGVSESSVRGLPWVPDVVSAQTVTVEPHQVLLLGTDGFGDPLNNGVSPLARLFQQLLTDEPPRLLEFAHALDFSLSTFYDDRTLVAVWPKPTVFG